MRIIIGTPAFGSQISTHYFTSVMGTLFSSLEENTKAQKQIHTIQTYTIGGESLLQRGRNHLAQVCLRKGWDVLFQIDADQQWKWPQFKAVLTALEKGADIVCGAVPLKTFPIVLNFVPLKEDEIHFVSGERSLEGLLSWKAAHPTETLMPVKFVGTAFMACKREVLLKMAETAQPYRYPVPATRQLETHWDMFSCKPMYKQFLSEDWAFCDRAQELGYKVHVHTDVVIDHIGSHVYSPGQYMFSGEGLARLIDQAKSGEVSVTRTPNKLGELTA